jgi:diacylglycerol kinase family enzyme
MKCVLHAFHGVSLQFRERRTTDVAHSDNDVRARPVPDEAPSRGRRALLLVNQHARSGTASLDDALSVLRRGGIEVTEEDCGSKRPIADTIRAQADRYDCVIVGGGDGTLNTAAPALLETGLPLGILPLGTGNDLARTLGIDPDPVAAAGLIVAGNTRTIDLGEVNGHPFFNVASIGFSAELARELTADATCSPSAPRSSTTASPNRPGPCRCRPATGAITGAA